MILEILKQKIGPDVVVFRRYRSDEKSKNRSVKFVPKLFSNNIYAPNHADISQVYCIIK